MKKQVLTIAICMALTASSALAAVTSKTVPTKNITPVACKCQEKTPAVTAAQPKEESCRQKFEEKMTKEREDLYCKLGLSKDQKDKAETLHQKNRASAEPLIAKFHTEKAKLHELKAKNTCAAKIEEQRLNVKEARKALRNHMKQGRKEFEAILSKDQLSKFKELRKEKKAECDKCKCHKHHDELCPEDGPKEPCAPCKEETAPKCPCAK